MDWRYRLKKTGAECPKKVGSPGERGFICARAHLQGQDRAAVQ